ncbi:MAG: phosphodiester glycosidase family protein [Bacteroidota bacterium]
MHRQFSITILIILNVAICFAQTDSLAVVEAKWDVRKVAPGIKHKHYWFEKSLFGASQNINILEVKLSRRNVLEFAYEPKILKPTSLFGTEAQALAAINGNFFNMKEGGSVDYVRTMGKVRHENRLEAGGKRALHQKAALAISGRKVQISGWDGTPDWEKNIKADHVMLSGPLLIEDGKIIKLDSTETYLTRHPRTAVAIKGKQVFLITLDGRNEKAAGMSLFELGRFLKWLHADDGLNLDGGGSTTMWINGEPDNGIINYPSDNKKMESSTAFKPGMDIDNLPADLKKWNKDGERPVANVILVKRKVPNL